MNTKQDNLLDASFVEANEIVRSIHETYYLNKKDEDDHRFLMIISALAFISVDILIAMDNQASLDVIQNKIQNKT